MKINKLVLPLLTVAIVVVLYITYFSPKDNLGLFSDFDTNSNTNREIMVKVLHEKGFVKELSEGTVFYVEDGAGKIVKVVGPLSLPPGMDAVNRITIMGHYHGNYFHAADVRIRN